MNRIVEKHWKNWLILLLVVMNVATLVTIFYNNCCCKGEETVIAGENDRPVNGQCFIKNMDFTPEQTASFRQINREFRKKVCRILLQLQEEKGRMFQDLQQTPADTVLIRKTARQIGDLHYRLKEETACFYLAVQEICSSEQKQKLKQYFTPLFDTEGCPRQSSCPGKDCRKQENSKL